MSLQRDTPMKVKRMHNYPPPSLLAITPSPPPPYPQCYIAQTPDCISESSALKDGKGT